MEKIIIEYIKDLIIKKDLKSIYKEYEKNSKLEFVDNVLKNIDKYVIKIEKTSENYIQKTWRLNFESYKNMDYYSEICFSKIIPLYYLEHSFIYNDYNDDNMDKDIGNTYNFPLIKKQKIVQDNILGSLKDKNYIRYFYDEGIDNIKSALEIKDGSFTIMDGEQYSIDDIFFKGKLQFLLRNSDK